MMPARTDEERASRAPLTLVFGGTGHDVRPLVLEKSRIWKRQVANALVGMASVQSGELALAALGTRIPEQIEAVVLEYLQLAGAADPQRILERATDEELAEALQQIVIVTFPSFWEDPRPRPRQTDRRLGFRHFIEFAQAEWGLSWEQIESTWSDERLWLMLDAYADRQEMLAEAVRPPDRQRPGEKHELLRRLGGRVEITQ